MDRQQLVCNYDVDDIIPKNWNALWKYGVSFSA